MSTVGVYHQPRQFVEAAVDPNSPMQHVADTMQANWALIATAAQQNPTRYHGLIASFDPRTKVATVRQKARQMAGVQTKYYQNSVGLWHMDHTQYDFPQETDEQTHGALRITTTKYVAAEGVPPTHIVSEGTMMFGDVLQVTRELSRSQLPLPTDEKCKELVRAMDLAQYDTQPVRPEQPAPRMARLARAVASALWNPVGKR